MSKHKPKVKTPQHRSSSPERAASAETFSSCEGDLPPEERKEKSEATLPSAGILKKFQGEYHWEGVAEQAYKREGADWAKVIRRVIIGVKGENAPFHLRYFEIQAHGYSSLERHHHEHLVIGIRGKGRVRMGAECHELSFLDILYIPPHVPHQLMNEESEPFGFFCIVRAERDKPCPLDAQERHLLGIPPTS